MNAEPGPDPGADLDSLVDALRMVMREQEENLREIGRMSEVSFRLWLGSVANRLAAAVGIPLARVHAFLGDLASIVVDAGATLKRSYRDEYRRARRYPRAPAN
ncbi:hypothetical protein [Peterkaempfera bronchialis]|uniref:Uncharacterized protein n=1 Tax=Peterkaempfera bronchialis TaxID=2126346 RepID=A0A345SZ39_9ACTN|nr:hypothetical protein [Peterkaempfera bronchialis]AXI78994.1 hypothetical protein C7M71_017805 [Peterkaempfera bronchialis]